MKQKIRNFKKTALTIVALACVITSATAIPSSATSIKSNYSIDVAGVAGSMDSMILTSHKHSGERSDTLGNYPKIYNSKTYAKGTSRVYYSNYTKYAEGYSNNKVKGFTLQKNSPSYPYVSYGTIPGGKCQHRFYYSSGGGYKTNVTSTTTY